MGRRPGPPPLPAELHRRRGKPSHGRKLPRGVTVIAPADGRVAPPRDGDELVERLLAGPAAAWIAEPDRLGLVVLVQRGYDEWLWLIEATDRLPDDWIAGRYQPAVLLRLDRVERNLTTWFSMLGLTPADRTRLGVAEVKARSRLEELRARQKSLSRSG